MANILVVDDMLFIRKSLQMMLESEGHVVVGEASNGQEAVKLYKQFFKNNQKPDIVLMNVTMPLMDGIMATREIRKFDNEVKIIMVSAMSNEATIIESLKAGAKDFVSKPFLKSTILSKIDDALFGRSPADIYD